MGTTTSADGTEIPTICSQHADCCDGLNFILDEYINQTYALTHWYCYRDGHPPNWTNTSNISGVIFDAPVNIGVNITDFEDDYNNYLKYLAEQKRLYIEIPIMLSQISGALSIFCCTIVIGIFIGILIYQPVIARRCSLRLSVAVSIADMIFSYNQAIPANDFNDWRCTAQATVQVWAELCSLFFTSSIALNLLLVFVFEFNNTKKIEPLYYAVPLLLATVLVAFPLYKNWFGYDRQNCFFRYDINEEYNLYDGLEKYNAKVNEITWTFYTSWMCASIIWCALVVVSFWVTITEKNRKKSRSASKLGTSSQGEQSTSGAQSTFKMSSNGTATGTANSGNNSSGSGSGGKSKKSASGHGTNKIEEKSQKMIQKAVMRIAFYPVVPLVTALPLALALSIIELTRVYQFGWFSAIMSNLQGFGNACIFYFDPAVALARETFRKYMTEKYVLKYHPIVEDGQRSKTPVHNENISVMYYLAKIICSRKKDFIVENAKKKGISKGSTAAATLNQKTKKNVLMDDDNVDSPRKQNDNYSKVSDGTVAYKSENVNNITDSMMTGSAMTESAMTGSMGGATQSVQYDGEVKDVEAIQIEGDDDEGNDEEIDEKELLKDIQNF